MEPLKSTLRGITTRKTSTPSPSNGNGPEPACPHCDGMGFVTRNVPVGHPDFGKAFPCVCQADQIAQHRERRLRKISNLDAYSQFRFENFRQDIQAGIGANRDDSRIHYEMAANYARNPHGWLVLQGGYGCGKTHLAAAIGHTLLEAGYEVIFVTVPDLLDHLRATYTEASDMTYDELFDRIRNVPVLILDDLGTENASPWATEKLYQLLNHRHVHRMATIITTNCPMDEIDGRIRSRLMDGQITVAINIKLPDYRRGGVKQGVTISDLGLYQHMTFRTFIADLDLPDESIQSLRFALQKAHDFAEEPAGWLIFVGEHGCGKTHLAAAIANVCQAKQRSLFFVTTSDLLDHLRAMLNNTERDSHRRALDEIRGASLLVLDDFSTRNASAWAMEKLIQIIEYRYLSRLPTVFTFLKEDWSALDNRIISRFKDARLCTTIHIKAPDYQGGTRGKTRRNPRSSPF